MKNFKSKRLVSLSSLKSVYNPSNTLGLGCYPLSEPPVWYLSYHNTSDVMVFLP